MEEQNKIWEEDEDTYDEELEFTRIVVGEAIQGIVIEVIPSKKYIGRNIYKIQEKEKEQATLIFGTSMMDRKLGGRRPGDEIRIIRDEDQPSDKGNPLQVYRTFHRSAVQEQTKKTTGGIFGEGD